MVLAVALATVGDDRHPSASRDLAVKVSNTVWGTQTPEPPSTSLHEMLVVVNRDIPKPATMHLLPSQTCVCQGADRSLPAAGEKRGSLPRSARPVHMPCLVRPVLPNRARLAKPSAPT